MFYLQRDSVVYPRLEAIDIQLPELVHNLGQLSIYRTNVLY